MQHEFPGSTLPCQKRISKAFHYIPFPIISCLSMSNSSNESAQPQESFKQTQTKAEAEQQQQQQEAPAPEVALEDEKKSHDPDKTAGSGLGLALSSGKRGREDDVGCSSGSKPGKKVDMELPSGTPTCYVCKKSFVSWKAVFGHLRAHPNRKAPGAFPPPTFTPNGSPEKDNNGHKSHSHSLEEQLAPTLLNLARQTMHAMSNAIASSALPSSSSRRGLDIDLNEPRISFFLDLNEVPPPADKDEEDDKIEDDNN